MDFYKRAAVVCENIPYGRVATYGQIALLCGKPHAARQVGVALNRKITGAEVPAHRIINHQGRLSGAAAFETADAQRERLEAEGVAVQVEGGQRVDLRKFGWEHTLEDALFFNDYFKAYGI